MPPVSTPFSCVVVVHVVTSNLLAAILDHEFESRQFFSQTAPNDVSSGGELFHCAYKKVRPSMLMLTENETAKNILAKNIKVDNNVSSCAG